MASPSSRSARAPSWCWTAARPRRRPTCRGWRRAARCSRTATAPTRQWCCRQARATTAPHFASRPSSPARMARVGRRRDLFAATSMPAMPPATSCPSSRSRSWTAPSPQPPRAVCKRPGADSRPMATTAWPPLSASPRWMRRRPCGWPRVACAHRARSARAVWRRSIRARRASCWASSPTRRARALPARSSRWPATRIGTA